MLRWLPFSFSCVALLCISTVHADFPKPDPDFPVVAFIGDSISVGNMTLPEQAYDLGELEKLYKKIVAHKQGLLAPKMSDYPKELKDALEKKNAVGTPIRLWNFTEQLQAAIVANVFDIEELSWGNFLRLSQGAPYQNAYWAAESGKRSEHTKRMAARILERPVANPKILPDQTFIFLTGNDLCAHKFKKDAKTEKADFKKNLLEGLTLLVEKGESAKEKVANIFVMSHLNVTELIDLDVILNKNVKAFSQPTEMSCRELRAYKPNKDDGALALIQDPGFKEIAKGIVKGGSNLPPISMLCPAMLETRKGTPEYAERLAKLNSLIVAYREAGEEVAKEANAYAKKNFPQKEIHFHFLKSPEKFHLENAQEIANDCFHLSKDGQFKLFKLVAEELLTL